jgi:hypothetical protein
MNPADELFDVVDANDVVIRSEARSVVHREGCFIAPCTYLSSMRRGSFFCSVAHCKRTLPPESG